MKKVLLLLLFTPLFLNAQFCDPNANVVIYSNYDGGVININIDEDIPNLKIGIVSYRAVDINFTGTYLSNVTDVIYAGFNSNSTSGSCPATAGGTTSINNAPVGANTSILTSPSGPNGNIICSYNCNETNTGGCNTSMDVQSFFLGEFNESTLYFHETQYGCWQNTTYDISSGGNCCPPAAPLTADLIVDDVNCFEACDGSITVNPSGGQAPYSFNWIGSSETGQTNEDLCPGNYQVEVTDSEGTSLTVSANVVEPSELTITVENINHPSCFGESGSVDISINGGTPDYIENWNGENPTNLPSGNYTVVVTDENNCTVEETIVINPEPDEITYDATITSDDGACTGSMSLSVEGGTPSYQFDWDNNPSSSSAAIGLCGGEEYCVTITDNNGCEVLACETISTLSITNYNSDSPQINVFPNPSEGLVTLTVNTLENQKGLILLKDAQGKLVHQEESVFQMGENDLTVKVPDAGVYFLTIQLANHTVHKKIVNK